MQRGEPLSFDWLHIGAKTRIAHLPTTKNGDPDDAPIQGTATGKIGVGAGVTPATHA